jgi:tetratricopeptide (TPR) repeat protein
MQRGGILNISAELIDARDNSHIWGEQYSRKADDIFALQGEIAKEMTAALRLRLTGEEEKRVAKSYTANPEAYQDYLKGLFWWNKRGSEEGLHKGFEYFQKAIAKDPAYALPYTGLAGCYSALGYLGFSPPKEVYPKAKAALQKALELDDTLADAHCLLGVVKTRYEWDWSGAERALQRAMDLNPGLALARAAHGSYLMTVGRIEDGIAEHERAVELDPLSLLPNRAFGVGLYLARRYDRAIEQCQKTVGLDPSNMWAHRWLAFSYLQKSMYEEGIVEIEKGLATSPSGGLWLSDLGYAYSLEGRRGDAEQILEQLRRLSTHKYVLPAGPARIYAGLGEKDKAFEYFEIGVYDRSAGGLVPLFLDPALDPLCSDPRFADLLRRMNLTP